ncbi:gliding motility-associated C-terminal domain-containing protein [uncultured Fibrella sp.]|uniref:gliding motility-associated C-terminal domain-containing protein n=1 Tax=uncultured Fibrella sp. TaxID=1284596 RepID=UPI0035CA7335
MARIIYSLFYCLVLLSPLTLRATHQVGGQLEMRAVGDVPGHFLVTVTNYFEDNSRAAAVISASLGIYRKRNNAQMTAFTAYESGRRSSIIYANSFCATQRNLRFITATYTADIQLAPSQYTDSEGYYISYQTRNRNGGINNLTNPLQTGFTFYLEFPSLTTTGKYINNSSPTFVPVNGEYVCLGQPFTYAFGGTDPDGDELRYSMETPLNVLNNNATAAGPYPSVGFASGYSATNAIPGSPALAINPQTGQLSVTASELGLFVFAIRVDEYRNGQKIGEVRRDFQLLVVDCPSSQTPNPSAQIKDLPVTATKTTLCPGESATLLSTINPDWNYQWQRDGVNLANATSSSLIVSEQGEYTVRVSLKNACTQVGGTQSLTINSLNTKPTLTATGQLCATDGTADLHVSNVPDVSYQWLRDGQVVAGAASDSLLTTQPGLFQVLLTHLTLGCQVLSDQIKLARAPAVLASLKTASGINRLCPTDPLVLLADGGIVYEWTENGTPIAGLNQPLYTTRTAGTYSLTATDANGCKGTVPPLSISAVPPVTPMFDSLPPFCGVAAPAYTLVGTPVGGVFDGPGTLAGVFTPSVAGIGQHSLSYAVRPAPECSAVVARRLAIVYPIPTIEIPEELLTFRGNSLTLEPSLTGNPTAFRWLPAANLVDSHVANAQVDAIPRSITYTLWVENAGHCTATDSIHITVVDHLYIPDAFTPNGDGTNDSWQLINLAAYPKADVTIFNRWGTVIFHATGADQKGFDGRIDGVDVPDGVYTYVVRPDPLLPPMQGRLLLMR